MAKPTRGVLLSAFGRRGYAFAAFNMALSIKATSPGVEVTLAIDKEIYEQLLPNKFDVFDRIVEIPKSRFYTNRIDPAVYKTSIYDFIPYDETLILDVDGCVMKDLNPLLDDLSKREGYIYTDVFGTGGKDDDIRYSIWAGNDYMWERFGLSDTSVLPSIQSSWMWVRKADAKEYFTRLQENYRKGADRTRVNLWGGTLADEMFFAGTFAQMGIIPKIEYEPIFFGNYFAELSLTELTDKYYVLSLYGNGKGRKEVKLKYIEFYDRLMREYCNRLGHNHDYKVQYIMADKHLNFG